MMNILLVDDDKDFGAFVTNIANSFKIKLVIVRTLKSAVSYLKKTKFDAYIIDGYLIDGSGVKLIPFIRKHFPKETPIIFVSSGYNDIKSFRALKDKFNVDYVINKPVKRFELEHVFKTFTNSDPVVEDDYLAEIRENYRKTIVTKVAKLDELCFEIQKGISPVFVQNLRAEVHKIGGSAGSYGSPQVSSLCKRVENYLKTFLDEESEDYEQLMINLTASLRNIKVAFQLSYNGDGAELYDDLNFAEKDIKTVPLIFMADDDVDLVNVLRNAFEVRGFQIKTAHNGVDAIKTISEFTPELFPSIIILDREMPDIDGLEIMRRIPKFIKEKIPILFLSSKNTEEDILMGLKAGATDYITKPFSLNVLMVKVTHMLKK